MPTRPRRSTTPSPTIRSSSSKACRSKTLSSPKTTSARSKRACRRRSPSSNRQQELAQEKIKADIAVTQATGRANSIRAEAQAQADATTLRGNAEASAIKAKGEALAANPNLVALIQAERWNGVLPTTLVPGSAVPFLNVH